MLQNQQAIISFLRNLLHEINVYPTLLATVIRYPTEPLMFIPGDRIIFRIAAITRTVLVLFNDAVSCDEDVYLSVI